MLFFSFAAFATIPVNVTTNPATCPGNNGSITIDALGGTAPFSYSLNGGVWGSSNSFLNLVPGTYTVAARDATGDVGFATATVDQAGPLLITATTTNATCITGGSMIIQATGALPPYQYSVDGASTFNINNNFPDLPPGNYLVFVRDNSACMVPINVVISLDNSITISAGQDTVICYGSSFTLSASGTGSGSYQWSPATGLSDAGIQNPVASPAVTTTYMITYTEGFCTATDNLTVSVSHPVADAGADATICNGGSVALSGSGSGAISYLWSPSAGLNNATIANPLASPIASTNYILTILDPVGCTAADTVLVNVITVDVPILQLNGSTLNVSNVNGAASYTWQQLNGSTWEDIVPAATGTSYTATANGNYRVKAVIGSCEEYSASQQAGRPAPPNLYGIYLYPNPANTTVTLDEIATTDAWVTLEVINEQGLRVYRRDIRNQSSLSINTTSFVSGIYTARLIATDGKTTVLRFVKL